MSFRSDHDAALARANALQEQLEASEQARALAEDERDAMRTRLAEAQRELETLREGWGRPWRSEETAPAQDLTQPRRSACTRTPRKRLRGLPRHERVARQAAIIATAVVVLGAVVLWVVLHFLSL